MIELPMTILSAARQSKQAKTGRLALGVATLLLCALPSFSQSALASRVPAVRIPSAIDNSSRAVIAGSRPIQAQAGTDAGKLPPATQLQGITLAFNRTPAQEEALQTLIAAQQDQASPLYHQWLTPEQFAARFGMADADIATVQTWLQQQGFALDAVSRSRDRITFSGTAAQVEAAFGTELHYYKSGTETHFAPAADISVPAALASVVRTVVNLSDYRPKARVKSHPNFTSSVSGNRYLTPLDVATIYDINAAYSAGYTGSNQSIAIVGQSFIYTSDIANFQSALGLPVTAPTLVLVPGSGAPVVSYGDESESDLDVEYSGAIAKGASIFFVYVGSSSNYSVFSSLLYAVDEKIAPIISMSYGDCEADFGGTNYNLYNSVLAQAAAQGQSVVAAAGDDGSTDCVENVGYDPTTTLESLAVDFPGSSQYVTAVGGTEIPAADIAIGNNTYFAAAPTTDVISSALSYVPEMVWNDDAAAGSYSSGGGGVSSLTGRPAWQTGVPGITAGLFRLVPDVSLDSSPEDAPYLFCTSDPSFWQSGQTASCGSGFRDSASNNDLTVAGGTSFAAPIFAGMLALINQGKAPTGQGVVNSTLYTLAANTVTYATAFHDIVSGGNYCPATLTYCTGTAETEYPATTGYDEASGLGSVDLFKLLTAWPSLVSSTLLPSHTVISAATLTPGVGVNDTLTITVTPLTTGIAPTGTLSITVDGAVVNSSLAFTTTSGVQSIATYTFSSSVYGTHVIVATYSGSTGYAASTASSSIVVGGTFTVAATNITVTDGNSGTSTVTVTPANGYTGTVEWTGYITPTLNNICVTISNVIVTGTAPVSTALTVYTNGSASACTSVGGSVSPGGQLVLRGKPIASGNAPPSPNKPGPLGPASAGLALAGLLAAGVFGRRSRKLRACLALCLFGVLGLALTGCSDSANAAASLSYAPKGTYTVTLIGTDSVLQNVGASINFTLTID